MRKLVGMREALASDRYFGAYLAGDTWAAWRTVLIGLMGEELTAEERATFTSLTGREKEPTERVREFMAGVAARAVRRRFWVPTSLRAATIARC